MRPVDTGPEPGHWQWGNMPVWAGDNAGITLAQVRSTDQESRTSAAIVNGSCASDKSTIPE